ncbi:MAG TPA: heme exporter protein CcmB, partial [Candidatus Polarisedimenticolaceae bacterium]|nr:heme exporter protein CcmB [Candidatus Polarisedimenticolaceae bacterium]
LRIEGRTFRTAASTGLFALVVLVVFAFTFDLDTVKRLGAPRVVPGVLWVTLSFASIVGLTRAFELERDRDALTALAMAPVDRGAVFAGKGLASLTLILGLQAILAPLTLVLFDATGTVDLPALIAVLVLHTLGLVELGTLFGAVSSRLARGEALLAVLLLPAATPILLSAVQCTKGALSGEPLAANARWMLVTAGFDVLYFLVALLVFESVLEEG